MTKIVSSALEAIQLINSGDHVWVHSMAATPSLLVAALAEHALAHTGITVMQMHLENAEALAAPALFGHLRNRVFFAGKSTRNLINQGRADYVPIFLSEIPKLFRSGRQKIDVALIQVSPPDKHGNCSLGVSVEVTRAAWQMADVVVAHINPRMPRTHGDSVIPFKAIDVAFEKSQEIFCLPPMQSDVVQQQIGQHVASLIDDGDCLQLGIGAIPDAVLNALGGHRNLGIHTEMFSDGVIDLVESGVINNAAKVIHAGKIVTGFVMGSQRLYDFVDDNALINFLDIEYVNNIATIRKNPQMVSINSALQIDLTGQICADSIGGNIYSGVGGQLDFVLGAQLSQGGRSIIALPSCAQQGRVSRIVPQLDQGAGVVTTRAHVDYIVTEFGIASLRGKSLTERRDALIAISHPKFHDLLLARTN
jgi:acyl-CoA hydrolase